MSDRKRCCCNCRHDIRTWDGGNCTNHCEIDGHRIGYVECFEGWCRRWASDAKKWQTDGYMTVEQAEDYRKMLDKAEHKVYGNIADTPQTDCPWK